MNQSLRRFRTFIPFLCSILLWSMFFGGFKFLIKNLTYESLAQDPAVLLERAVALLSIGGFLAYIIGGAVVHTTAKRYIILRDAIAAIILLIVHYLWARDSMLLFSGVTIMIGIFYGVFAVIRSILTAIEMEKTKLPDTTVNAIATITFIASVIVGAWLSTFLFEQNPTLAFWSFLSLLVSICVLSPLLRYDEYETAIPLKKASKQFFREAWNIFKTRPMLVLPATALWSIATVVSIKSIPYAQATYSIAESQASLILLWSALGAIIGNALTSRIQRHRWRWFRLFTYAFACLVIFFHALTTSYPLMIAYSIAVGLTMGGATNLIDAYYLRYLGEQNLKESGTGLYGIVLNLILAGLLFGLEPFSEHWQFYILGGVAVVVGIYVRIKLHVIRDTE